MLKGEQLIVDITLIEANVAMETIKHKETGETYQQYLKKLAEEDGLVDASITGVPSSGYYTVTTHLSPQYTPNLPFSDITCIHLQTL